MSCCVSPEPETSIEDLDPEFEFEQLSEKAKDVVREKFREHHLDHDWWDDTYGDFINVAACLGFSVPVKSICFSGFYSQGDGASFTGTYAGDCAATAQIIIHAPKDEELRRIAESLDVLSVEAALRYQTHWRSTVQRSGNYCHARTMSLAATSLDEPTSEDLDTATLDAEDVILPAARDLADWLYKQLEAEHEYLMSDEAIDPLIVDYGDRYDEFGSII